MYHRIQTCFLKNTLYNYCKMQRFIKYLSVVFQITHFLSFFLNVYSFFFFFFTDLSIFHNHQCDKKLLHLFHSDTLVTGRAGKEAFSLMM